MGDFISGCNYCLTLLFMMGLLYIIKALQTYGFGGWLYGSTLMWLVPVDEIFFGPEARVSVI